jgi:hypothetical protein
MSFQVGTILNHSIGSGCNQFYQIVRYTAHTITARRIESKAVNVNVKRQTCDYVPVRDKFEDKKPITLRYKVDAGGQLQIGPIKRMIWWSVWDGKPKQQYSL